MKNLILFYPSYERGGATKVLETLSNYLSKKKVNLFVISNKKIINGKNVKNLIIYNNSKYYRSRLMSSILGSNKLIRLLKILNKSDTKILSMQSSFFSVLISKFMSFKISIRVSEDPCRSFFHKENLIKAFLVYISKILTYNLADKVIVNSSDSQKCLKKISINKNKVIKLYNPALLTLKKNIKIKNNKTILNVGRFCKQKNQILLLKAFKKLTEFDKNYKLILCGDGPDKQKIIYECKKLRITKKVKIVKWRGDISNLYKKSSLFILTSLYEGMPNVLIEALNHNMICLSTKVSGVNDLLKKNKKKFILKSFNSEELFQKILKIDKSFKDCSQQFLDKKIILKKFQREFAAKKYFNFLNSF